jgi:Sap, sulfolipid-1-addressing protein
MGRDAKSRRPGPSNAGETPKARTDNSQHGNVPGMWSSVLVLALLIALNPLRLGITLLLISRPRPLPNLLAYWVGNVTSCIPTVVLPLALLHVTPIFKSFAEHLGTSSIVKHIQVGAGVFALSVAALMTVRFVARPRAQARPNAKLPTSGGSTSTSTLVLDHPNTPPALSRLLGRAQEAPTEGDSAFWRLLGRARSAWENGSVWVAFVIGLANFPAPDVILMVLAVIAASGAAIGTQVSAAVVFVVAVLAVVEITLISYVAAPAKTQAALRLLHDWAWIHRRKIVIAVAAVGGLSLVANGMGGI